MTDLPFNWVRVPLSDIAEVRGGIQKQAKRRPVHNKYPFLRVANVGREFLDLNEVHEIELFDEELDRYHLQAGDLLVVEGNGSSAEIGRAALWGGEIRDCVHQNHLIRVRPSVALLPRFLELAWNSRDVVGQLRSVASTTSGLYTLSVSKIKRIEISVPPLEEQRRIVAALEGHLSRLAAANSAVQRAANRAVQLRSALLAEAFAGQLVDQDPEDEDASLLLERIRVEQAVQGPMRRVRRSAAKKEPQKETLL